MSWILRRKSGFTLVEILLVSAIALISVGMGAALSVRSVRNQEFFRVTDALRSEFAAAQGDAMAGTNATSWGISVTGHAITRFQGSNFAGRNAAYDMTTTFSDAVVVSGTFPIVFQYPTGLPLSPATTTVQSDTQTATITVNRVGRIDVQ